MTSALDFALEVDAVFLFVVIGIAAGQGVSIGSGWLRIPGVQGFVSFWRGFAFLLGWATILAILIYVLIPAALVLMQEYPQYVLAANLIALGFASLSFGAQADMRRRATLPTIGFFVSGFALTAVVYFLPV